MIIEAPDLLDIVQNLSHSPDPVIDHTTLSAAKRSSDFGWDFLSKSGIKGNIYSTEFSALELAISLGYYNFLISDSTRDFTNLEKRFKRLVHQEGTSSNLRFLPTIGIEVESPRKKFCINGEEKRHSYEKISNNLRMPINRASSSWGWEFSTPPSYSSDVQAYLLNQLIKARLIPSLDIPEKLRGEGLLGRYTSPYITRDSLAAAIQKHLDSKLVSLHINLCARGGQYFPDRDFFNAIFAIAFTTPLRLASKSAGPWDSKDGFTQMKFPISRRFEMKSFEVSDLWTYRLLKEVHLWSSILHSPEDDNPLWAQSKIRLKKIFEHNDLFYENSCVFTKEKLYELAKNQSLVRELREEIRKTAIDISRTLKTQ